MVDGGGGNEKVTGVSDEVDGSTELNWTLDYKEQSGVIRKSGSFIEQLQTKSGRVYEGKLLRRFSCAHRVWQ